MYFSSKFKAFYPKQKMCGRKLQDFVRAIISSDSYPTYDPNRECTVDITVNMNRYIKAYIVDLSISYV